MKKVLIECSVGVALLGLMSLPFVGRWAAAAFLAVFVLIFLELAGALRRLHPSDR